MAALYSAFEDFFRQIPFGGIGDEGGGGGSIDLGGQDVCSSEIQIGGFVLSIVKVDSLTRVTIKNNIPAQNGGLVAFGTPLQFSGFDCSGPHTFVPQERLIRLTAPPDVQDEISGHFTNKAYEFQPRIAVSGAATFRQIRIYAKDEPEILGMDRSDPI